MARQIVQHLRTNVKDKKPTSSDILNGEIAVNYTADGETLYIKNSSNEIVEFKDDKYYQKAISDIANKIFIGTQSEYDVAYAAGKIAIGAIVVIIDDEENTTGTSSKVGEGVVGEMILG
jgi:phosphoenolpyruvate synthase/pyruvate phosphate dikinase